MQTNYGLSEDMSKNLGRRGFLGLSLLAIGGRTLGGLDTVAAAPTKERLFETPRWSTFRSILPADDGYLLTGIRTNSVGEQVGWGVRLDDDFDTVWNRAYLSPRHLRSTDRGEEHDGIEFALPDTDGGFFLVGWSHSLGPDSRFGWVMQIGKDGIPWWVRSYNRDDVNSFRDDFADGVKTDDGVLLVGRTIASEYLDEERGDGWVVEIDVDRRGRVLWERSYDPNGTSDGLDDERHTEFNAVTTVDDGYLVVGETSPDGPTEDTNTAAWALRIDSDGDPRWSRTYRLDRRQDNEFRDVVAVDDGFLVAGVAGEEESVRELHDYEMQGRSWAAKLDERGRVVWEDFPSGQGFYAVEPTANGAVFVGRRNGRAWGVVYDEDGKRLDSDGSTFSGSGYTAITSGRNGSRREFLPVGYGSRNGNTNGLLSRFAGGLDDNGSDDDDDDDRLLEIVATERGEVRYEFTVDGDVERARVNDRIKAEDDDRIEENDDGTVTVRGQTGNPGYGDAFRFDGDVIEFESRGDAAFFLRLDGDRVSVEDLLDEAESRLLEIVATERGDIQYEFTVDGEVEGVRVNDRIKAEDDDRIRENDDGTYTVRGQTGNTGYGDAFRISGDVLEFESRGDADFFIRLDGDRVSVDELIEGDERLLEIIGREDDDDVRYEFTVDGQVERARASDRIKAEDSDRIQKNSDGTYTVRGSFSGKGYGDAFRFTGDVIEFNRIGDGSYYLRLDGWRVSKDELVEGDDDDDGETRLLELVATERGEVRYEFTVDGDVEQARVNDRIKAEDDDRIRENDDGTVTVRGQTGNPGYGDAFRLTGDVLEFESSSGVAFFIRLDGKRVSVDELVED